MKQNKEKLREKLIGFQKEIAGLRASVEELSSDKERALDTLLLKMIELMDYFETEEANIADAAAGKADQLNSTGRIVKTAKKKITRILKASGVERIDFADGAAAPDTCRVVDTVEDDSKRNGAIAEIIKNGYSKRASGKPLRKAEVITVNSTE